MDSKDEKLFEFISTVTEVGLQNIIPDEEIRNKIDKAMNEIEPESTELEEEFKEKVIDIWKSNGGPEAETIEERYYEHEMKELHKQLDNYNWNANSRLIKLCLKIIEKRLDRLERKVLYDKKFNNGH